MDNKIQLFEKPIKVNLWMRKYAGYCFKTSRIMLYFISLNHATKVYLLMKRQKNVILLVAYRCMFLCNML